MLKQPVVNMRQTQNAYRQKIATRITATDEKSLLLLCPVCSDARRSPAEVLDGSKTEFQSGRLLKGNGGILKPL